MSDQSDLPPDVDELKFALQRSPLLRALGEAAPDAMRAALKSESYPAGTVLFHQGDPGDRVYTIWSGRLRIQLERQLPEPVVLRDCYPGDMVGEMSLVDNRPRSATVLVAEDSRLISLSRADFQKLVTGSPEVAFELLAALSHRLRSSEDYLLSAARQPPAPTPEAAPADGGPTDLTFAMQWQGVSHLFEEIATAADDLVGQIEAMQKRGPSGALADSLGLMHSSASRIARHIDPIELIARLDRFGEGQLALTSAMVGGLSERAVARLVPKANAYNVRLAIRVEPGIPLLTGDNDLLEMVVTELCENAMRYSPPNGQIEVRVEPEGRDILVSVTDHGTGVPEDRREVIFEPFVRGPNDERRAGLGLALCRAVVEAHSGRIWVEETPGGGATFKFQLPARI